MSNKRVFVSFAVEDQRSRDLLKGQSLHPKSPFEFIDMSVKEPWDSNWKTNCRTRIKGCHGVIALLSKNTMNADGARWEIKCAIEEKKPTIGMHISSTDRGAIPPELVGQRVITWDWDAISNFIDSL